MDRDRNRDRDLETPEIVEEMSEDLERTMRMDKPPRRQRGDQGFDFQKRSLILGGVGLVVVIILLLAIFSGGDKTVTKEMNALKARLDVLEKRLARVEGSEQKLAAVETQAKGLQSSLSRLEGSTKSLREQIDKLNQKVDELPKKVAPAPAKTEVPSTPQKKATAQADKRFHDVRPGDTLFSIAKKYGLTVDELRRLNNLDKNEAIQPGQKVLVVTPPARQ
jgi:LysM repeat protein